MIMDIIKGIMRVNIHKQVITSCLTVVYRFYVRIFSNKCVNLCEL